MWRVVSLLTGGNPPHALKFGAIVEGMFVYSPLIRGYPPHALKFGAIVEGMFDGFLQSAQVQTTSAMGLTMNAWVQHEFQVCYFSFFRQLSMGPRLSSIVMSSSGRCAGLGEIGCIKGYKYENRCTYENGCIKYASM